MSKKIHYLDGLRGYAACIVVMDHWLMMGRDDKTTQATSILWEPWFLRSPLRMFVNGGFAVAVFFVLSGYVLLIKIFKDMKRKDLVYSGMTRRYVRLMIPSFTALLLYYAWLHFGPFNGYSGCHSVGEVQNNIVTDDVTGKNFTLVFNMGDIIENGLIGQWTYEPAIYTIEWTLQIEFIGSLIIYLLVLFFIFIPSIGARRHSIYAFLLFFISLLWWIGQYELCPLPLQYLYTFVIGMALADLDAHEKLDALRSWKNDNPKRFLVLQISMIVFAFYFGTCPYQQTLGKIDDSMWAPLSFWLPPWIWLSIGATLLMLSLLTFQDFQRAMSTPLGQILGKLSFSIYLLHYQVLILLDILIMPYLGPLLSPAHKHDRTAAAIVCLIFLIPPLVYIISVPFQEYCDELSVKFSNDFRDGWLKVFPTFCACLDKPPAEKISGDLEISEPAEKSAEASNNSSKTDSDSLRLIKSNNNNDQADANQISLQETTLLNRINWQSKPMIWFYAVLVFIIVGSIPAKEYDNCYSSDAVGGLTS